MNDTSPTTAATRLRWPAISVRTRIVAAITTVAALGLAAVGVSVYLVERQLILEQVDARLAANLDSARYIVAGEDPDAVPPSETDPDPGDDALPDTWTSSLDALAAVVQRMSPDDNVGVVGVVDGAVAVVPGFRLDLDLQDEAAFAAFVSGRTAAGEPVIGTYAEGGVLWRYLAAPIAVENSPEPAEVLFVMAYDLEAELAEINVAAQVFLIASVIVVLLIAATGTIVATRLLRPLRRMRETAERVSGQSLSERLPIDGRDDVSELARTMNDMLDRLDEALDSQRRLLSDVGHELKTPITIVRGYVEVMNPDDPADVRDTQTLASDELDRMGRLVQDLAGAASLHGPSPIQPRPVDTADLMSQIIRKAEGIEGAEVTAGAIDDTVAVIDPARLTQAMLQLAQNAVTHGGGRLVVGCRASGDAIEFWIRDFGPGVPDDQKTAVFERFHRGDDAAARPGSGLGLNIVQVIARAHGGSVRVVDAPGGGSVFLVSLPHTAQPSARVPHDGALGAVPLRPPAPVPPRPPLPARPPLPPGDVDSSAARPAEESAASTGTVKGG